MIFTLNVSYVNVRKVPFAAPHDFIFGVRFEEVSHRTLSGVRYCKVLQATKCNYPQTLVFIEFYVVLWCLVVL